MKNTNATVPTRLETVSLAVMPMIILNDAHIETAVQGDWIQNSETVVRLVFVLTVFMCSRKYMISLLMPFLLRLKI